MLIGADGLMMIDGNWMAFASTERFYVEHLCILSNTRSSFLNSFSALLLVQCLDLQFSVLTMVIVLMTTMMTMIIVVIPLSGGCCASTGVGAGNNAGEIDVDVDVDVSALMLSMMLVLLLKMIWRCGC